MSEQSEYTFILKIAVVLILAWVLIYQQSSGEEEVVQQTPTQTQPQQTASPSPELVAALTEPGSPLAEAAQNSVAVDPLADQLEDPLADQIPEELQAALDEAVVVEKKKPRRPLLEPPGLNKKLPGLTPPETSDQIETTEGSNPDELDDSTPAQDEEAENSDESSVVDSLDERAPPRELLSMRDAAYIDEMKIKVKEEKERLKQEYEQRIEQAVLEEKKRLEEEKNNLSDLYEDEIAQLKSSTSKEQEMLQKQIEQLKLDAQQREERLRAELATLQQATVAPVSTKTDTKTPLPPEGHQQNMTFKVEWGDVCGLIDKSFLTKEFEATPGQPMFLSIEPLFPDTTYFTPMRIALPAARVLTKSSTTVSFYTGEKPLSLAVYLCKDSGREGRCLNKPPVRTSDIIKSEQQGQSDAYHQSDKSYLFAYMLAVRDKLYLLDPTQGKKYFERLEKALSLLSLPDEEIERTIAKISGVSSEMSASYMKYSDRHFSLILPQSAQTACRAPGQ